MLKERLNKKEELYNKESYDKWKKYEKYLIRDYNGKSKIYLNEESFIKFRSNREFIFDNDEFGFNNGESNVDLKRRTFLFQDSTLRIQLIKAEYAILSYYRLWSLIMINKEKFRMNKYDKAFINLIEIAVDK